MKQKIMEYVNRHNIEMEISYDPMDNRKIDSVDFYTPDGYQFDDDLHCRCFPDLYLMESSNDIWQFIYKNMCQQATEKCPINCNCKEVI
jgi:hypothetical protein